MRIVVCIKQILDPEISPQGFQIDRSAKKAIQGDAALVINPFDENAIEVALQLRDRQKDVTIIALTLGQESSDKALRKALSMGCDEAAWIRDSYLEEMDFLGTAKALAKGIGKIGNVDLVLCGRQAGDWDMGQVGCFIAEELSLPCATMVFHLDLQHSKLILRREAEKGVEVAEGRIPSVVTVTSVTSNQPRLPTTKGILSASRKKITHYSLQDLQISGEIPRLISVEDLLIPSYARETKIIDGEDGSEKGTKLARYLIETKMI